MLTYKLEENDCISSIGEILHKIDKTFPIPLSEKTDIDTLAHKSIEKGYVYLALDDKLPVAILGFYANDLKTFRAYMSVLGVLIDYQGLGIAKRLLLDSLAICKGKGMTDCVLYTHRTNENAIALYKKFGFVEEYDPDRSCDIKFVKKL